MAYRAATIAGAAIAGAGAMETVIKGKLLSPANLLVTKEKDFAKQLPDSKVGIATVIDKLGPAAAGRGIDNPTATCPHSVDPDIFPYGQKTQTS